MISIVLECNECHSTLTLEDMVILDRDDCDGWFIDIDETSNTAYCMCPHCNRKMLEEEDKYIEYRLSKLLRDR